MLFWQPCPEVVQLHQRQGLKLGFSVKSSLHLFHFPWFAHDNEASMSVILMHRRDSQMSKGKPSGAHVVAMGRNLIICIGWLMASIFV